MKTSTSMPSKLLSRILPIATLALLIIAYFFTNSRTPKGPLIIIDDDVPLASLANAYFIVVHPDVTIDNLLSPTEDMFDYAGEGSVLYSADIYDDPSATQSAIASYPDMSAINEIGDVNWCYIVKHEDWIVVAGIYTDYHPSTVDADFYLLDSQYESIFTNVTPNMAEYVGAGLLYYSGNVYNREDTVLTQLAREPDYSSPDGQYIQWGSAYKYQGKYLVMGKYVEGERPTLPNEIPDIDVSSEFMMVGSSASENIDRSLPAEEEPGDTVDESIEVVETQTPAQVAVNVRDYGAVGNGKTDDTEAIIAAVTNNPRVYFPAGTYKFDPSYAAYLSADNIYGEGIIQFSSWSKQRVNGTSTNVFAGTCEISRMNDTIYMASHWPGEAQMDEDHRNNITVSTNVKLDDSLRKVCYQGGIARVSGVDIPDNFTLCLGKGQLYAYKDGQWLLLREGLPNFKLYDASWVNPSIAIPYQNYKKYEDHVEINLTKEMWFPNDDEMLLHYFCPAYELSDGENASDYEYYFATFTAWVKDAAYDDNFLFGVSMDMKNLAGKVTEVGIGKKYLLKSYPRTAYFYTVPDSRYDELITPYF